MNLKRILFIVSFLLTTIGYSQLYDSQYLKLSGGYEKNGYTLGVSFINHIENTRFLEYSLNMEIEKYKFLNQNINQNIPVQIGIFNINYYQQIFSLNYEDDFIIYFGGGALGGYEWINNNKKFLDNNEKSLNKSKFIYGLSSGLFIKKRLFDFGQRVDSNVYATLEAKYNYFVNSDVGTIQPLINLGVAISIF